MSGGTSLDDIQIIDVDAHISETTDLWSSRAPAALKDRLPRIEEHDRCVRHSGRRPPQGDSRRRGGGRAAWR